MPAGHWPAGPAWGKLPRWQVSVLIYNCAAPGLGVGVVRRRRHEGAGPLERSARHRSWGQKELQGVAEGQQALRQPCCTGLAAVGRGAAHQPVGAGSLPGRGLLRGQIPRAGAAPVVPTHQQARNAARRRTAGRIENALRINHLRRFSLEASRRRDKLGMGISGKGCEAE